MYFLFPADMSESDLIYTETLMQRGKENYEGKEIVILGGGDGALLWELLKEKPKFVYMLEVGVFSKKNTKINKKL
jgi:spermine synthase